MKDKFSFFDQFIFKNRNPKSEILNKIQSIPIPDSKSQRTKLIIYNNKLTFKSYLLLLV